MGTTGQRSERPATGRFPSLAPGLATATPIAGRRATGVMLSLILHAALIAAATLLPLVFYQGLPASSHEVRAFFAEPLDLAPPPPPPPPPPAQARRMVPRRAPVPPPVDTTKLVAPVKVPDVLPVPEASLDLGLGVEGGVPGGVAGGVPGGVVGGIVGGLPLAPPPPPPAKVVRVGGNISAPALLRRVAVTAVRQWRYRPLLLNGEPTEFILTVTVNFQLR
jgi:periplasmic protein TonB